MFYDNISKKVPFFMKVHDTLTEKGTLVRLRTLEGIVFDRIEKSFI